MKRDIKINVDHLDGMTKKLAAYLGVAAKIRLASERYMEIMLDQESDAYHNLAEEWRVMVVNRAQLLQQNITDAYRLLERYISSMGYYIGPKDSSKMMRVDRNDIWWNLEQAKWHLKDLSDIHDDYYQSYANYKHYFWEEILHSEEEWKTIKAIERREKEYRESNYDKMQEMKRKLSEDIEEHLKKVHWKLYNEKIKPFENEDDAFADEADKFYDKIKTFADGAQDVATAIVRVGKGAGDALLGTLDGIYTIGLACSPTVWIMNHYGLLDEKTEQRVDNFTGGIEQLFTDPVNTLEAMGQSCMDTYDEEGLAYAVGNVGFEVVFELALAKGMGKVLDTMDDVTDAAKTVGKLDEVVDSVDDVHLDNIQKNVDVVGEGGSDALKFNNWDDMKDAYKGTITQFVKENKPKYSPDIKKWFDNGGSIEIQNIDGKQVWTYTSSAGDSVPYIDGYIKFPDEYLNPTIKSVDIGEFTGDRGKDIDKMLSILEEDYGITEIPEGYIVHHDIENGILQLVDEKIHTEFTHIGGHSIYK